VPIAAFREVDAWGMEAVMVRGREVTVSAFRHGAYTVWGLTERVLRQFLSYAGEPPEGEPLDPWVGETI
jgi:hypothetical protein